MSDDTEAADPADTAAADEAVPEVVEEGPAPDSAGRVLAAFSLYHNGQMVSFRDGQRLTVSAAMREAIDAAGPHVEWFA